MADQNKYEGMSDDLVLSAEATTYDIGVAYLILNKTVIEDPTSLVNAKTKYNNSVNKAANNFNKSAVNFADNDVTDSYIAGYNSATKEIKSFGKVPTKTNSISDMPTLIKNKSKTYVPEASSQIIKNFENMPNHWTFAGAFREAAYSSTVGKQMQILRAADDLYRKVAIQTTDKAFLEGNIFTRRKLSQQLLNEYARNGLKCITYRNGARYSLESYCEMLGRTIVGRSSLQGSINRFVESGYTLCVVSSHFRACDLCTPYEGVTLSMDGKDKRYESILDAELQGLFHPRCLHNISIFDEYKEKELPRVDAAEQKLIDEYGYEEAQKISYKAQQKQRYIERQIRYYKRKELLSLERNDKVGAKSKVLQWQKMQREHLASNSYLPRKYSREQIGKAY